MTFSVISPASLTPLTAAQLEGTDLVILWNPNGASATKMQTITVTQLLAYLAPLITGGTYQPLDADLTAIAALTTAPYGRDLLTLSDQAALRLLIGLANMAYQSAGAVAITGGTVNGTTIGATTASTGRFTSTVITGGGVFLSAVNDGASGAVLGFGTAAGLGRWNVGKTGETESGGNTGSNFGFYCFDDAGTLLRTQLVLDRSTGLVRAARLAIGTGAFYTEIVNNGTANRTLQAPNANGTIARTEDFAAPPTIGSTTPGAATFSKLNISASTGTFYVSTTGSNANDGLTVGTPFLTIQRAIDVAASQIWGGVNVNINLANGTYTHTFTINCKNILGCTSLNIVGNTVTPSSVVITNSAYNAFGLSNLDTTYNFSGFRLNHTNGDSFAPAINVTNSNFVFSNIELSSSGYHISNTGGSVTAFTGYTIIAPNFNRHVVCFAGGTFNVYAVSVNIVGTLTCNTVLYADTGSTILSTLYRATGAGTLSGEKWGIYSGAVITSFAADLALNPGTVTGSSGTGGIVNGSRTIFDDSLAVGQSYLAGAKNLAFINNLGTTTLSANPVGNIAVNMPTVGGTLERTTEQVNLTDSATVVWDLSVSSSARLLFGATATRALFLSGAYAGMRGVLRVRQDSVGGRTITHNGTTITISSVANSYSILNFYYDGSNYFWTVPSVVATT